MKNKNKPISFLWIIQAFLYAIPIIIIFFSWLSLLDFFTSKYVSNDGMISYYQTYRNCWTSRGYYVCDSDIDKFNIQEKEKKILKLRKYDNLFIFPLIIISIIVLIYLNIWAKKLYKIFKKTKLWKK